MTYPSASKDEQSVVFPLCWQVAIGTMGQVAARGLVMRIMRARMRMRISAVRGRDIGGRVANSTAGLFALSSWVKPTGKIPNRGAVLLVIRKGESNTARF